ncbi:MAG: hypothetical protein AAFV98_11160 [Chloroflexota bacterium]
MSDKYYVHDCQTHGHGCQNTYTMLYDVRGSGVRSEDKHTRTEREDRQSNWLMRLFGQKTRSAKV